MNRCPYGVMAHEYGCHCRLLAEPTPSAIEQCQVHSTPLNWCNQCGINEGIIQERSKGETPLAIIMDKLDDLFYAVDANAKALIELADKLDSRTNQGTK